MSLVDVILIFIVGGFTMFGLFFGLVRTLGGLIGTIVGMVVASRLVGPVYDRFGWLMGGGGTGKVVAFLIVFFVFGRIFGLGLWLLRTVFGWFAWIPLAGLVDRILGAAFGLIEGIVFVSVALFFALQFLPDDAVKMALSASIVGKGMLAIVAALQVIFPSSLKAAG
ncbi:CvpA family protein [Patescibacteria group bacterium]|nr:MAG: CvpA family protein [Patescibacteria group bacterium]